MAGVGKWVKEIRRKLGEWAQALEEQFTPEPEPEFTPVRVPAGRRPGAPSPPEHR